MKQSIEYKEIIQVRFWLSDLIKTVKNHPENINITHELFQLNEFEGDIQACEQNIMTYFEGRKYVFAGKMLNRKRFSKFNLN